MKVHKDDNKGKTGGMRIVMKSKEVSSVRYKKVSLKKRFKESWEWYLLLLPALIYLLIFNYGPMYGLQIAFKDYRVSKGIWGSEWVGLKYFVIIQNPSYSWL